MYLPKIFLVLAFFVAPFLISAETTPPTSAPAVDTAMACMQFLSMEFGILNYDQYETYFKNDSYIILAEAGQYTGIEAMTEYVKFVTENSPFISTLTNLVTENHFMGYNETSEDCIFDNLYVSEWNTSALTNNQVWNVTAILKLFYSPAEHKVTRMYVYYDQAFLEFFFGEIDTPTTAELVCQTLENNCSAAWSLNNFSDESDCMFQHSELPLFSTDSSHFDGLDKSCRVLHSVLASNNDHHCPHISFVPMEDDEGKIKCQSSSERNPTELFDAVELEYFNQFKLNNGIDPLLGYKLKEETSVTTTPTMSSTMSPTMSPTMSSTMSPTMSPNATNITEVQLPTPAPLTNSSRVSMSCPWRLVLLMIPFLLTSM